MSESILVKKHEAKTVTFTMTVDSVALDLTDADLKFCVKTDKDDVGYLVEKNTIDFNISQAALGIVTCTLSTTDTNQIADNHIGEIRIILVPGTNVDKSEDISFIVEKSVIDD